MIGLNLGRSYLRSSSRRVANVARHNAAVAAWSATHRPALARASFELRIGGIKGIALRADSALKPAFGASERDYRDTAPYEPLRFVGADVSALSVLESAGAGAAPSEAGDAALAKALEQPVSPVLLTVREAGKKEQVLVLSALEVRR